MNNSSVHSNHEIVCITEYYLHMPNNNNSNGNVAVITGSSKGIGKAIAREFAKNGYSVVLNSRDEEDLSRVAQDIAKEIGNNNNNMVSYIPGDI